MTLHNFDMPRRPLSVLGGARAWFGGLGFVVSTPSVWRYAIVPVVIAGALLAVTGGLVLWGSDALTMRLLAEYAATRPSWTIEVSRLVLRVVFALLGLLIAGFVSLSLAQPLSGFALDAISRRQEGALGSGPWPALPWLSSLLRSLRVTLTALAVGLPVLLILSAITLVFPAASVVTIPLKCVTTGLLTAYDLLDYPLSQRGFGPKARVAFIRQNLGAVIGFGVSAAASLLVPGLALLLLPGGVAGAARLVVAAEQLNREGYVSSPPRGIGTTR
jgi:CysZ protein